MGFLKKEKKEIYCDSCRHFRSPKYYENDGCYHPANVTETVVKTPVTRTETYKPIRSYMEMNARNDCVLFKQRVVYYTL